jgi:very-short-patch-repair endonuclease
MISCTANQGKPEYIHFEKPINPPKGRKVALTESSFIEFILNKGIPKKQLHKEFGIVPHVYETSMQLYKSKYAKELKAIKHSRYSNALKGNTHGAKDKPAVILDKDDLKRSLDEGRTILYMAEEFETTEWFIRENVKYHELTITKELPYRMVKVDESYLTRLEMFTPGITESARTYYDNPHRFHLLLYDAFCKVAELQWFIKDQAKSHGYYRETNQVPKDHICWSLNPNEMRLSRALLDSGIPHQREVCFYKNYRADFSFPEAKLLVEIDGSFHEQDETKARDEIKEKAASKLGYKVLHFTPEVLKKDMPWVISQIKESIKLLSNQSNQ